MADDDAQGSLKRKITLGITWAIQAFLVAAVVWLVFRQHWQNMFLTIAVIAINLVPAVAKRAWHLRVPAELQIAWVSFAFLSLFLGSAADWYYKFWWWDVLLHSASGILLGLLGLYVVYMLNQSRRQPAGVSAVFLCVFAAAFSMALGVVWEIFEFTVDSIWPSVNMQSVGTGVVDTMFDLIYNTAGAIVVAVAGWWYLRGGSRSLVEHAIDRGVKARAARHASRASDRSDDAPTPST